MNQIVIGKVEKPEADPQVLSLTYLNANKMLTLLRSDYFRQITLEDVEQVETKTLKFLIQLGRLLKADGSVLLKGTANPALEALLLKLSLHEGTQNAEGKVFTKSKPEPKVEEKEEKLAIGFKSNEADEQIDENDLLEGQNLEINKTKADGCATKVRACANCSCGRKETESTLTKEQIVKSINDGKPMAGCGKCSMGDSFRCGTCPYNGLPAFKPGDKLKLTEEGGVVVSEAAAVVTATGKVKLEL